MKYHSLGHLRGLGGYGLKLERRVDSSVLARNRVLMRLLYAAVQLACACAKRVLLEGSAFCLVYILLKITQGLVELQIARGLIKGAVDRFVELLLLHVHHLLDIFQLQEQEGQKREPHY